MVVKFSHHRHTGKLRPHRETSYALLAFLVLVTGIISATVSVSADAATTAGGTYTVQAVVPGPKPTQPAIITSPTNGQSFQVNPITVMGTCQKATLVKIFKNGVLAGSILCSADGHFSMPIDLLIGANALTAVSYNTNDEAGPVSPAVNVTLAVPVGNFGFSSELLLQSTSYYRGVIPGDKVVWPIEIIGGLPPYALNFEWGDGKSNLLTRLSSGPFTLDHIYDKVGGYLGSFPLIIRATDSSGRTAYLQLTTIVNDPTAATGTANTKPGFNPSSMLIVWPLLVVLGMIIMAFWMGERREKVIMQHQLAALA